MLGLPSTIVFPKPPSDLSTPRVLLTLSQGGRETSADKGQGRGGWSPDGLLPVPYTSDEASPHGPGLRYDVVGDTRTEVTEVLDIGAVHGLQRFTWSHGHSRGGRGGRVGSAGPGGEGTSRSGVRNGPLVPVP